MASLSNWVLATGEATGERFQLTEGPGHPHPPRRLAHPPTLPLPQSPEPAVGMAGPAPPPVSSSCRCPWDPSGISEPGLLGADVTKLLHYSLRAGRFLPLEKALGWLGKRPSGRDDGEVKSREGVAGSGAAGRVDAAGAG